MRIQAFARSNRARLSRNRVAIRGLLGVYVALSAMNAQAAPAPDNSEIAQAFGNTIVSAYPDGTSQKVWLHPDGTWNGLSRKNKPLEGRWFMRGPKMCLRQSHPWVPPISYCSPLPDHPAIGVQWASRDLRGIPIKLSLQKGMPPAQSGTH